MALAPAVKPCIGRHSSELVHVLTAALVGCGFLISHLMQGIDRPLASVICKARSTMCFSLLCRKTETHLERLLVLDALRALAALQLPFAARTGADGRDPAALLVAAMTLGDSGDVLDAQISAAAPTAVAALLVPPDHHYGHGETASCCMSLAACNECCSPMHARASRLDEQQLAPAAAARGLRQGVAG